MEQLCKRYVHTPAAFIQNIVANTKRTTLATQLSFEKAKKKVPKTALKKKLNSRPKERLPNWLKLNDVFNIHYEKPSNSDINKVNRFFNKAKVEFEWCAASFDDIPENPFLNKKSHKDILKDHGECGTTLIDTLPEVIFLGGTNVGKSSILNNITTSHVSRDLGSLARVSKTTGFTKTLNCYNVGNRLRMIDSPGYGFNSSKEQGKVTLQYLLERKQLVRCFLLLAGDKEINNTDNMIIQYIHEHGVPFEVVFTKMDKVKDLNKFKKKFMSSGLMDLPTLPRLVLTNSLTSSTSPKRFGIDLLRYVIFQSCGLIL
ncbi:BAQ_1a_G0011950.mRNA.1.CDS.1 [Saccharomyces cerevisiae]|nr:BAQ_1a_G0011950.mRNA.1.CDS.1 [Saccharomyces cerevisiae]CAI4532319.1 BAM_G0020960.mRNA.1.CDS.1 [Saccharomyces cerevisiae]CAI7080493.1 BAQ_1a_G0011950.mRNA.1.CDS.1 [Saccharomyces cerevisiae]CAI7144865.1 BAM_G0020960.mRNA.1.CDS.1 [Saccharomyces cerevisiae]